MRKGLTYIELVASIAVGVMILYIVISFPTSLLKLQQEIDRSAELYQTTNTLALSIHSDLESDDKILETSSSSFSINNNEYHFREDGVFKSDTYKQLKIANCPLGYKVEDSLLKIYVKDQEVGDNTYLVFYLGGGDDE